MALSCENKQQQVWNLNSTEPFAILVYSAPAYTPGQHNYIVNACCVQENLFPHLGKRTLGANTRKSRSFLSSASSRHRTNMCGDLKGTRTQKAPLIHDLLIGHVIHGREDLSLREHWHSHEPLSNFLGSVAKKEAGTVYLNGLHVRHIRKFLEQKTYSFQVSCTARSLLGVFWNSWSSLCPHKFFPGCFRIYQRHAWKERRKWDRFSLLRFILFGFCTNLRTECRIAAPKHCPLEDTSGRMLLEPLPHIRTSHLRV